MWHVASGNGVLSPAEWAVFRFGAELLIDEINIDIDCDGDYSYTGVSSFDSLDGKQKLYHLALVSDALSDASCPSPPLTCLTESTVAAVLGLTRIHIDLELDSIEERYDLRHLLRELLKEMPIDQRSELPDVTCGERQRWMNILEMIGDRVFWDDDYLMQDEFKSMSAIERHVLQIDSEYFAKPRRRTAAELANARQTLDRVISGKILRFTAV